MTNLIKQKIEAREYPVGNWVSIGHPTVVEVNAMLGFDFVLIDTEHTTMSLETVEHLVRAVEARNERTGGIVRVPDSDPTRIKRVLDIGVDGVMIPMVETAEEARSIVEATLYPPDGTRGIAGGRAAKYGLDFPGYINSANGSILKIAQIETMTGLENVEEIAAVDGIDALFVGPADLTGSLDMLAEYDATEVHDAIGEVLEAGRTQETPIGTLTVDPDRIEDRVERGFDFQIVGKDAAHLSTSSKDAKERYEQAVADRTELPRQNE
ncbi:HpcH/HpaI aldolase family protein [Natrarchaeobius oligotrophus]|uniref:Aldolase n=1 Tax=Natrarchaeobius chitinivorans TaxID=1679083 RepID=A0A3N6MF64_NATCH|nr:aldolase/citrate lyase family protein [Natrarchaeobius chitinivorans]RQH02664.1 aldolase [Natrarchaeobius chitinivorans]